MKLIAAVSLDWGIGINNKLLFSIPVDMKFFRETTAGHTVVMGRKTLESFPAGRPLKNRNNIVLSKTIADTDGITVVRSLDALLELAKKLDDEVFVIGGESVYRQLLPYSESALITKVNAAASADSYFPNLDADPSWSLTEQSEMHSDNGFSFSFCTYTRNI